MSPYPIILSFITFFATLLGGYVASRNRKRFGVIAAFSAGVLIAVPLFQLLPASLRLADNLGTPTQNVLYMTGLGFIFLHMLERLLSVKKSAQVTAGNIYAILQEAFMVQVNLLSLVSRMASLSGLASISIFR
jgi:zinc transporter ZupT